MTADFENKTRISKSTLSSSPTKRCMTKSLPHAEPAATAGVVLFDAIWPAEFSHFDLRDVSARIPAAEREKVFRAMNTVVYKGKTLGMPWILDTKYLYYNKAMLDKAGINGADHGNRCWTTPKSSRIKVSLNTRWCGAGRRQKRWCATTPPSSPGLAGSFIRTANWTFPLRRR